MFCRVGGKTKLRKQIVSKFPEHKIYVEPFVGGGSVFFEKEPAQTNVINDLDNDIYNMYVDMKKVGDTMTEYNFFPEKELFWTLMKQTEFKNDSDRLYRNLYISNNSFSGDRNSFVGPAYVKIRKKSLKNLTGKKWKTTKWKNFLNNNNVKIHNEDFASIIKQYDSEDTFIYLDPPYSKSSKKDYAVGGINPSKIFDVLQEIKSKFILSYDDCPEIKKIFSKYNIFQVETKYSRAGEINNYIGRELLISNFQLIN